MLNDLVCLAGDCTGLSQEDKITLHNLVLSVLHPNLV